MFISNEKCDMRNLSFIPQFRRKAAFSRHLYVKTAGENFLKANISQLFPLDSGGSEKSTPLLE